MNPTEGILQIVLTKLGDGEFKIAAMGIGDNGMGQTIGTSSGPLKVTMDTLAVLAKMLEVPK